MNKLSAKIKKNKIQRQKHVRSKIFGTAERPRLCVFRSNRGFYLQLIDDNVGKTLVSVNIKEIKSKGTKVEQTGQAGKLLAEKALEKGIVKAIFDRSGHKYHGRVKSIAEAARAAGLKI